VSLVKCPFCAEEIQAEATKCKHCREFIHNPVLESQNDRPELHRLRDGTPVKLRVVNAVSSAASISGDRFGLELHEDLHDGKLLFAKAGAHAVGTVSHAKRAGMIGKGGELNVRVEYLKVGDSKVMLRGSRAVDGTSKSVASWLTFGTINLVRKGKNVEIPQGSIVKAYVDDDFMLPAYGQATEGTALAGSVHLLSESFLMIRGVPPCFSSS
jgi:hypothetical protein